MGRWNRKRDANETELQHFAEQYGASYLRILDAEKDAPDAVVGFYNQDVLVEVKEPDKDLRPTQDAWHKKWRGRPVALWRTREDVVTTLEELRKLSYEQRS